MEPSKSEFDVFFTAMMSISDLPNWLESATRSVLSDRRSRRRLFVLGCNEQSRSVIQNYKVSGVIDDFAPSGTYFENINVVRMSDVGPNDLVVNCISSISPVTGCLRAKKYTQYVISYCQLRKIDGGLPPTLFVSEQLTDVSSHSNEYFEVFRYLSDDLSRKVFFDVLGFRCTGDISKMFSYRLNPSEQYFEDFMSIREEVFLDVGGFDGDTALQFATVDPNYRGLFLMEPSEVNRSKAIARLADLKRVSVLPYAAGAVNGYLNFDSRLGSASCSKINGDSKVAVRRIDSLDLSDVSFIKMDIEGGEVDAIRGASEVIRNKKPKLAIAAYHKASDFRLIFQLILELRSDYQVYLRHYTEGWSETVMYFR